MIFGLEEAADEDIHSTVKEVFMSIEGKPFSKQRELGNSIVVSFPGLSRSYWTIQSH